MTFRNGYTVYVAIRLVGMVRDVYKNSVTLLICLRVYGGNKFTTTLWGLTRL